LTTFLVAVFAVFVALFLAVLLAAGFATFFAAGVAAPRVTRLAGPGAGPADFEVARVFARFTAMLTS